METEERIRAISVEAAADYSLLVTFSTGEKRFYDCTPLLVYPVFHPLKNLDLFLSAHSDGFGIVWIEGIGIYPEEIYQNGTEYPFETSFTKMLREITICMWIWVVFGLLFFAFNVVMLRIGWVPRIPPAVYISELGIPVFYLITLLLKKQRTFAYAIYVISIIGLIFTALLLGMGIIINYPFYTMLLILFITANGFLVSSARKFRKTAIRGVA
jgi:hypothetical protein